MGLFSSSSRTTQTQETINNNKQVSTGDISGVYVDGSGNTITTTDHGAVARSIDFAAGTVDRLFNQADNVLQFSAGAIAENSKAWAGANESIIKAQDNAFQYTAGLTDRVLASNENAYKGSMDSVNRAQDNAYQYTAGLTNKVIDAMSRSVDGQREANRDVLEYGAGVTQLAFDAAERARSDSLGFAAGAFKEATSIQNKTLELNKQFATEAFNQIGKSNENAYAAINSANNNAFSFSAGAFNKAIDSTAAQSKSYMAALTEFADKTISTAVQSTKSESAQATDKIIDLTQNTTKYLLWAVGGLGALFLLARMK